MKSSEDYSNPNDYEISLKSHFSIEFIFQSFLNTYSNSSIILLIDETNLFPISIEIETADLKQVHLLIWRNKIRDLIQDWSDQIGSPIYYISAEYSQLNSNSFFVFPNQGMIAWLQYRHLIDLKNSIFVYEKENANVFTSLGLRFVISSVDLFADNLWDLPSRLFYFIYFYLFIYYHF